jgi:putative hemolysin
VILLAIAIIVVLIAVNALFVAAEFAAVSVRRSRIQQLSREGNAFARALLPILDTPVRLDRYIAACQVGITISSIVLGAYGQATLPAFIAPLFEGLGGLQEAAANSVSAVVILIGLTIVQVVLGELVPKSLALQFPTQTALYTAIPMRWSLVVLRWLIVVLNGSGMLILRLLGSPAPTHVHTHSPDEIELLIVQSSDGGLLNPDERIRLRRALKLSSKTAHDIMIPRPRMMAIDVETPVEQLITVVGGSPYTRMPVYRDNVDNVIGLLHTKDLVRDYLESGQLQRVEQIIRPILSIPEMVTVDRVLSTFRARRAQQAIVVDEYGGVAGLVTLEDVLAEVFGDFGDEFKLQEESIETLEDGRIRVNGAVPTDDVTAVLGVDFGGHADTIGGRVVEVLGFLPAGGEVVAVDGLTMEVEEVEHLAVKTLLITPMHPEDDNDE